MVFVFPSYWFITFSILTELQIASSFSCLNLLVVNICTGLLIVLWMKSKSLKDDLSLSAPSCFPLATKLGQLTNTERLEERNSFIAAIVNWQKIMLLEWDYKVMRNLNVVELQNDYWQALRGDCANDTDFLHIPRGSCLEAEPSLGSVELLRTFCNKNSRLYILIVEVGSGLSLQ